MHHRSLFLLSLLSICLLACTPTQNTVRDFSEHYKGFNVEGSFILLDLQTNAYTLHHPEQVDQAFLPASTFKICNSLIALETGVVPDLDFTLPWDSVTRQVPAWNQDTDFRNAFRNSTVWYYQEIARRIGQERMDAWLTKLGYGNADASGGIDLFWLTGGLRTTPRQQVDFIARLVRNELPLAQRSMDLVKEIMLRDEEEAYTLRGKTGWGFQGEMSVGWFVGYVEKEGKTYAFANCIQTMDENHPNFAQARIDIAYRILEATLKL
jgi:beta-lactamase class D